MQTLKSINNYKLHPKTTMKTFFPKQILMLAFAMFVGFVITACDDDDEAPAVDKTELQEAIDAAIDRLATTEEGINDGQFTAEDRAALQSAIDAAEAVIDDASVTQEQVDNAGVALNNAVDAYNESEIAPVAEADLVAHWSFDEGTGTVASDNSANGFDGEFKTGHIDWGAGFPEWAEDRNGEDGKALHFNEGANIEIPYNTNLNPQQMTIALWINADEINENNRFIGLNSWIAYKFQLQTSNVPFYTVSTEPNVYLNFDAKVALPINEWHHIAVTFGDGKMTFYIDGVMPEGAMYETPGEAVSISDMPYNLVIGQDFPTDQYAADDSNFEVDHKIPLAWGGYFRGFLDEIRIYKAPLTAAQIETIYNREKPE